MSRKGSRRFHIQVIHSGRSPEALLTATLPPVSRNASHPVSASIHKRHTYAGVQYNTYPFSYGILMQTP